MPDTDTYRVPCDDIVREVMVFPNEVTANGFDVFVHSVDRLYAGGRDAPEHVAAAAHRQSAQSAKGGAMRERVTWVSPAA